MDKQFLKDTKCLNVFKEVRRSTLIEDENGKEMQALPIFSMAINYMRNKVHKVLSRTVYQFSEDMVDWVLTVPAIWDDRAKQFMREAAIHVS